MRRVTYRRAADALLPEGNQAVEQFEKLHDGEVVGVEITRPRSPKFNAMVHLTIERTATAMRIPVRDCYGWLLIRTGHASVVCWPPGTRAVVVPHAISDMDAITFESFWESASDFIRAGVLPHLAAADAEDIAHRLVPAAAQ